MELFTIGHSTRSLEELIEALRAHGVETLVDIRTAPRSRHVPQFNQEVLAEALPAAGIAYVHMRSLGGWRKPARPGGRRPDESGPNAGWRSEGFRAYADYMLTAEFEAALSELLALARERPTAIMCAEVTPKRCHRMLVSDTLTARGVEVWHIVDARKLQLHEMTPFARIEGDRVIYPSTELRAGPSPEAAV